MNKTSVFVVLCMPLTSCKFANTQEVMENSSTITYLKVRRSKCEVRTLSTLYLNYVVSFMHATMPEVYSEKYGFKLS